MPDYVDTKIFAGLKPETFNALSSHFHLGIYAPEDVDKTPSDDLATHWHALLNLNKPKIKVKEDENNPNSSACVRDISGFHDFLQRLHNLAEGQCNMVQLAKDLNEGAEDPIELPPNFEMRTPYERGAFIFLNDQAFWENLCNLSVASNCEKKRLWIDYYHLPKKVPTVQPEDIRNMEKVLVDHFAESKRSAYCKIHNYVRKTQYYYFATLRDTPKMVEALVAESEKTEEANDPSKPSEDTFGFHPLIHPFRIIFSYDERGEFSIYGELGKKDFDIVAKKLVKALVGYDGWFERVPKAAYCLDDLKDRNFDWQKEASDGIDHIKVNSLTIMPYGDGTKITLANRNRNIYDCLDDFLNRARLPNDAIEIQRASIQFVMDADRSSLRSFSFDIAQESSGVKNLEEQQKNLGEKYIRKLGFIYHSDISLHTILKAARAQIPVVGQDSFCGLDQTFLQSLIDFKIIERTDDATEIRDGDDVYPIVPVQLENGEKVPCYQDKTGKVHRLDATQLARYRINYSPILKCIYENLACTGDIVEEIPQQVWHLGLIGSEHRNVYVARNWDADQKVVDYLTHVKNASLVLHIGHCPRIVQIGQRRSDAPADHEQLEAQYYQIEPLMDYTVRDGYVFNTDVIRKGLDDLKAAKRVGKIGGRPVAKQGDRNREAIERWLWLWFDARLKAAKVEGFVGEPAPYVNIKWLEYEYYTQKAACDLIQVKEPEFSRARKAWAKDKSGIGDLMLLIADGFVKRRSKQCLLADGGTAERLNNFYKLHEDVIKKMRQQRPHYI